MLEVENGEMKEHVRMAGMASDWMSVGRLNCCIIRKAQIFIYLFYLASISQPQKSNKLYKLNWSRE
jgi:hypothetical protein